MFLQNQLGENVENWTWDRVISVEYKHTLGAIPALRSLFNVGPFVTSGGDQVINAKPAPDIYLKAASSVNVAAKNCIAFEDSDVGTKAAHAAGVPVIQIPDISAPNAESIALGHLIFNSLDIARDKLGWR